MSLNCYYHPEREASTKCEKCGKIICLECKMVYHETYYRGTGDDRYAYTKRYEYCPVCYYDTQIKKHKRSSIGFIFLTIMLLFMLGFMFFFNFADIQIFIMFLSIGITISIVAFIYMQFIRIPKKVEEVETKKEEFLRSTKIPKPIKEEEIPPKFCPECGTSIESGASICSYCGFVVKE
ncbi:MAG: zinc-ribbon domain-containing protein [Promethearchaeota archaeon]